jgi:Icc-related predicted phosphoesterase
MTGLSPSYRATVGPVGGRAVRTIIEVVQLTVSLHCHTHEAQGVSKIGSTVFVNPGSKYGSA